MSEPELRKKVDDEPGGDAEPVVTDEPSAARQEAAPPPEPARLGPLARLMGILLSPGETYEDINRKPTWIVPIIIAVVVAVSSILFMNWRLSPVMDQLLRDQITQQMARTGQEVSEEVLAQQVNFARFISTRVVPLAAIVMTPLSYLFFSGLFALGLMLYQAKTTFIKIFSVVSWTFAAVGLVTTVVFTAALMLRDEEGLRTIDINNPTGILPTNLGVFLSADASPVLRALVGAVDLFSIWLIVLLSIGLAAVAGSRKIKASQTGTLVVGLWLVWVLIRVGLATVTGR